jgi:flagellar biosynthesis protein FlhB
MSAPSSTPQLRPLGVGEILDAGFRLVRRRFGTLVVCTLVVATPLTILSTLLQLSADEQAFDFSADGTTADAEGSAIAASLIANLIQYVMIVLIVAACFRAVSAAYLGQEAGAGESLRFAVTRMVPLLVALVLVTLALIPAFVLLIVPGIWLGVRLSMTFPAIVFERLGPLAGMARSFRLVKGQWWRTFGVFLVAFLLMFVLSLALGAVIGALAGALAPDSEVLAAVVVAVVSILVTAALYPVWAAITAVLYYDLRVRKEGFDLELMAQGVGGGAVAAPGRPGSIGPPAAAPASEGFGGFLPPDGSPGSR